ncbi:hypothetical protein MIR68_001165 [Amoeboaphelidium protococcarum]|nr:hypothetical protein MIR68_001165 [Amoeboaphelidium protococcarum]
MSGQGEDPRFSLVNIGSPKKKKPETGPVRDGKLRNISHGHDEQQDGDRSGDDGMMDIDANDDKHQQSGNKSDEQEQLAKQYLAEQTQEVIVPSYASWFQFESIHDLERKALPEFFSGRNKSKTPAVYQDYRDFMVNTYRLNPGEYLTVTACRRNLAGDVCAIIRVHAFLEQWGLINYQVNPASRPSMVAPPYTGHFRVTVDAPKGLVAAQPGDDSVTSHSIQAADVSTNQKAIALPSLALRKDLIKQELKKQKQYQCATCGVDCSSVRYHNVKNNEMNLCPLCFLEGRFPSSMSSGEFVKIDTSNAIKGSEYEWSQEENMLLLEGIEMFDDDWIKIAEHVGTRTKEQCVLHFLQLPIEDQFLDVAEVNGKDVGPLQFNNIPFSQSDNPVMSVVAFLASTVNPGLASSAAKAALKELEQHRSRGGVNANGVAAADDSNNAAVGTGPSHTQVQQATAVALSAAAVKAKTLGDFEDREIQRLTNAIIEMQMKKIELKMNQFEELEVLIAKEKQEVARQRHQLFLERLNMQKVIQQLDPNTRKQLSRSFKYINEAENLDVQQQQQQQQLQQNGDGDQMNIDDATQQGSNAQNDTGVFVKLQ